MEKWKELQEIVKKKGYGSSQYNNINGETVYLSRGIKETFLVDEDTARVIIDIVSRFQNKDYGTAAEYGKESRPGHEYGRYACTPYEAEGEDTAAWVHRTEDAIKVYFKFER